MTILFHLDEDGGFTAGNTATGFTSYAYPTSTHARMAKREPVHVARAMLAGECVHPASWTDIVARDERRMEMLRQVGRDRE